MGTSDEWSKWPKFNIGCITVILFVIFIIRVYNLQPGVFLIDLALATLMNSNLTVEQQARNLQTIPVAAVDGTWATTALEMGYGINESIAL